jgi:arabinan endo-1,5-alpha-L-arabinosidase
MNQFQDCARNWLARCLFWFLTVKLAALCAGQATGPFPAYGATGSHDPSTLLKDGAKYFIFSDGQGIGGKSTPDLRNWTAVSAVFPGSPPAWTTVAITNFTGYFWAPDIAYFNGRYNLYYACSQWGTINSAIGLVTSPSLVSPVWTDQGKVIQSNPNFATTTNTDLTAYNCIDPSIMVDTNGSVWMSFGSYSDGILIMQLDPFTGKRIAANSPIYRVSNNGPVFFSNTEEASCLYQRGGYYYLFVNFGGCCAGVNSTYNIRVGRSATVAGPYYDKSGINMTNGGGTMVLESTARFIGPGHAAIMNDNGTNWFTFHYYDGNNGGSATLGLMQLSWTADGWPVLTNDWSALYTFNTDAREHLGLYNGSLQNGAAITNDASRGKVLGLTDSNQFVNLPLSVANASTFAAWVKWNGGADWQRVFDFGSNTTKYFFLTPRANTGKLRFAIKNGGAEQTIDAPSALASNSWQHVAVTLDGTRGLLYLNGSPVATNTSLTIRPWQLLTRSNYVGESQFTADPPFSGKISSFRIFGRALSAAEIKDLAWAQPTLAHRYSFTSSAWDSVGLAHGTLMGNATVTNGALKLTGVSGGYVNLPGGLVSGSSAVTIEFWATFGVSGNWARVFDFGNISGANGSQYVFFSPHTGSGTHRVEISSGSTVYFDGAGTLDNRTVYVACIVDPTNGYTAIYTNGILEKAATNTLPGLNGVNANWSFIGRSLFSADAWLNATIDEFHIYDGRLAPEEIAADYKFGPDALALPVNIISSNAPSGLNLSWPAYAAGFALETSPALGGSAAWTNVPASPALNNDRWQFIIPPTNPAQFYRLRR